MCFTTKENELSKNIFSKSGDDNAQLNFTHFNIDNFIEFLFLVDVNDIEVIENFEGRTVITKSDFFQRHVFCNMSDVANLIKQKEFETIKITLFNINSFDTFSLKTINKITEFEDEGVFVYSCICEDDKEYICDNLDGFEYEEFPKNTIIYSIDKYQ